MLYAISRRGVPSVRNTATERFLKTGGRPPEGIKMVGRWHDIGKISGTAIAETNDPTLMAKWALEWNDLFEMDVRPVITDEQAGPLMAQIGKQ
jgi:hypothetical protein